MMINDPVHLKAFPDLTAEERAALPWGPAIHDHYDISAQLHHLDEEEQLQLVADSAMPSLNNQLDQYKTTDPNDQSDPVRSNANRDTRPAQKQAHLDWGFRTPVGLA